MNKTEFKEKFDAYYSVYLKQKVNLAKSYFDDQIIISALERVYEIFGEQGKRVRPYILYLMYTSADGKDNEDYIVAGIALELLHAFALIHDDICDRGNLRHGTQTIQKLVKQKLIARGVTSDIEHVANSYAMLIGDVVLAWSYEALNVLENQNADKIRYIFHDTTNKLMAGQLLDISFSRRQSVSDQELSQRELLKTATYTFINPALMGAVLAGKEQEFKLFCQRFGLLMGEVYQIQDDLFDILGEAGTPKQSDIHEHQHTFLTQYVMKNGTAKDKQILAKFFSGKEQDTNNEKEVIAIVSRPKVVNYAKLESKKRIEKAKQQIRRAKINNQQEKLWLDMIEFLETRFI